MAVMQELVANDILSGQVYDDVLYIGNRHEFATHVNKPSRVTCSDLLTYIEMHKMGCWDSSMARYRYCDKCCDYNKQYVTFFNCGHNNCVPCMRHTCRLQEKQGFSSFLCGHPKCEVKHLVAENRESMEMPETDPFADEKAWDEVDPDHEYSDTDDEGDKEGDTASNTDVVVNTNMDDDALQKESVSVPQASSSSNHLLPVSLPVPQAAMPPVSLPVPQAVTKGSKAKKRDAQAIVNEVLFTLYLDCSFWTLFFRVYFLESIF